MNSVIRSTFLQILNTSSCCSVTNHKRELHNLAVVPSVSSPCACFSACNDNPLCNAFGYNAALGRCLLCSQCSAARMRTVQPPQWTAWKRAPQWLGEKLVPWPPGPYTCLRNTIPPRGNLTVVLRGDEKRLPLTPKAARIISVRPLISDKVAFLPNAEETSIAEFIGTRHPVGTFLSDAKANRRWAPCNDPKGEALLFRRRCTEIIRRMENHLSETRHSRRALLVQFDQMDNNNYGWGHAMPMVYLMHWLCVHANRRCFVRMYDHGLGLVWGYANGESWHSLEAPWNTTEAWRTRVQRTVTKVDDNLLKHLPNFTSELKNESASLVVLTMRRDLSFTSARWLANVPLKSANGGLDRCFCRYVTHPRFLASLPPRIRAPRTAYHFRTGFADIPEGMLVRDDDSLCALDGGHAALHRPEAWVEAACGKEPSWEAKSYVMADSTSLASFLISREYKFKLRSNPLQLRGNSGVGAANRSTTLTRSWNMHQSDLQGNNALLYAAADYYIAGLANEVQGTPGSSFARPIIARSMCIRRAGFVNDAAIAGTGQAGVCPKFDLIFGRDISRFFDDSHLKANFGCWRDSLIDEHPCKRMMTSYECRRAYVDAMS